MIKVFNFNKLVVDPELREQFIVRSSFHEQQNVTLRVYIAQYVEELELMPIRKLSQAMVVCINESISELRTLHFRLALPSVEIAISASERHQMFNDELFYLHTELAHYPEEKSFRAIINWNSNLVLVSGRNDDSLWLFDCDGVAFN